jgi:hypothetical protein
MTEQTRTQIAWSAGGVLVPAGLLIGIGVGWAVGYLVQGLLIGLGGGFVGMALARLSVR